MLPNVVRSTVVLDATPAETTALIGPVVLASPDRGCIGDEAPDREAWSMPEGRIADQSLLAETMLRDVA